MWQLQVCQWAELRQANRHLEQQNRDLLQRVLELQKASASQCFTFLQIRVCVI